MIARICSLLKIKQPDMNRGLLIGSGDTVPVDGTDGWQTGALFQHTDGGVGTCFYINEGTVTSSAFVAVAGLTAAQEALLGATAGTVTASKAVIVDASKNAATFGNVGAATVTAPVVVMTGTTGAQEIRLTTNLADALSIEDTAGDLIVFATTTGSQLITITPATTVTGAFTASTSVTTPVAIMTGTTGNQEIRLTTNLADALSIEDTAGDLIVFTTTTGSQLVTITPATTIVGLLTASDVKYTGVLSNTAGAAASAAILRLGKTATEGTEVKVIDEVVTLTNAVETNLTETVPSGAVILSVQANLNSAVTGDASGDDGLTKVGIGVTADPDKYGLTSGLTKNLKADTVPAWTVLSGAEQICVKAADNAGAAVTEKFVAGGTVRVRVVYVTLNSLDDAA